MNINRQNIYIVRRANFSAGMARILREADETIIEVRENGNVALVYTALDEKYPQGGPVIARMTTKRQDLIDAHLQIQGKRETAESQLEIDDVIKLETRWVNINQIFEGGVGGGG